MLEELGRREIALSVASLPDLGATAHDTLMLNLLATFAEFEKELIGDRMADALASLKRRGRRVAGGFR